MRRHPTLALSAVALAVLGLCSAALAGPNARSSSGSRAADALSGRVTSTRGHWRHDHGRLAVRLAPSGSGATRHLAVRITGSRCGTQAACLKLTGTLSGTITARASNPDVGRTFAIKAHGTVAPLGHVSATGTAHGTGFVAHGRVTASLTLTDSRGAVTVSVSSAPVPGFTSP
jgi:hypothetical protein